MRPRDLTPQLWRRIDEILREALDLPAERRSSFLDQACEGDPHLRSQVEVLMEAETASLDFFEHAQEAAAATLLDALCSTSYELGEEGEIWVGPFRVIREIGRGGMGVVYLAEDTRLGRRVALKLLAPLVVMGKEPARLFASEARAVSAVDHPNVATLFEADVTEAGYPYMAFAYYDGITLSRRVEEGPIPWPEAEHILHGLVSGLEAAHAKGIVHGDVKPSNVLLTGAGEVKLLDFGIATMAGASEGQLGSPFGTAAYMSPERVAGQPPDQRSDLWSVGAVLYEMLSGHRPFEGDSTAAVLKAVCDQPTPPLQVGKKERVRRLAAIAERLLLKDPAERYQNAEELLTDLDRVSGRRPKPLTAVATVGALIGASLIGWALWRGPAGDAGVSTTNGSSSPTFGRLAVLPFENIAGDSTGEVLSAGVRAELISALGSFADIDVLSGPAMPDVFDASLIEPELARRFDVQAFVQGTLSIASDTVVLTTSLVEADTGRPFWAETYRADRASLPRVAGEVAFDIEGVLRPGIDGEIGQPGETRPPGAGRGVDPDAYQAYLRGVFHLDRSSRESLQLADRYLRRAIELDPSFAAAYANLAEARGRAAFFGLRSPTSTVPGVLRLIERAIEIDSTLALAHARMAPVLLFWERDPEAAERAARRAVALNPSAPEPHRTLSETLAALGRHEEAMESALRAAALDPWSQFAAFRPGVIEYYAHDFEAAAQRMEDGLNLFPEFWQGYWVLCMARVGAGRATDAVAACQEAVRRSDSAPMSIGGLGVALARSGNQAEARRLAAELVRRSEGEYVGPMFVAAIFAALDDADQAFTWLDRAYRERDLSLVQLGNHAQFDALREDPRFDELLSRMGLEDPHPEG